MLSLIVKFNENKKDDGFAEVTWPDLARSGTIHLTDEKPIQVAILRDGMGGGKPSVAIRIDLPDGKTVVAETSARLFVTAGRAVVARYPDLFDD